MRTGRRMDGRNDLTLTAIFEILRKHLKFQNLLYRKDISSSLTKTQVCEFYENNHSLFVLHTEHNKSEWAKCTCYYLTNILTTVV